MSEKIYVGSVKTQATDYGEILKVALKLDGLKELYENYGFLSSGGNHILKLNITKRKEPGQYGETHNVWVDTWKPEAHGDDFEPAAGQTGAGGYNGYQGAPPAQDQQTAPTVEFEDDVPF